MKYIIIETNRITIEASESAIAIAEINSIYSVMTFIDFIPSHLSFYKVYTSAEYKIEKVSVLDGTYPVASGGSSGPMEDAVHTSSDVGETSLTIQEITNQTACTIEQKNPAGIVVFNLQAGGNIGLASGKQVQGASVNFNVLTHPSITLAGAGSSSYVGLTAGNKTFRFTGNDGFVNYSNGGIRNHNGSVGKPSYRLTQSNDTGYYWNTTEGCWAFAVGAIDIFYQNDKGLKMPNLPTSPSGLTTGQVYSNSGVLTLAP